MTETVQYVGSPGKPGLGPQRKKRVFWRRFLFWIIFLFVVANAGYLGFARAYLNITDPRQAYALLADGGSLVMDKINPKPPFGGRTHINILLLGADMSFGSSQARSDTIKFISVDLRKPAINILSIPRDTWVEIPGHGKQRINAAFQFGGPHEHGRIMLAGKTVENLLTGVNGDPVKIDHYVRIQTGGFIHIVDALGGVDMNVEKKMDYEDPSQDLFIHLKPGMQHLDGYNSMCYVRFRHDAESDFGRMRRQDQFLRTLLAKLRDPKEHSRLPRLVGPIMSMLRTDIKKTDLLALKHVADQLGMDGIFSAQLPVECTRKGAAEVVEIQDEEAAKQVVSEVLTGPRPTVVVLNGTGEAGVGKTVSEMIDPASFNVVAVGTTVQPVVKSEVLASKRFKQDATTLAQRLNVTEVDTESPIPAAKFDAKSDDAPKSAITIVLGNDFAGVPVASTTTPRAATP
ncbi:MAG: LCP family protein [Armatimonadota bacterium]